MSDIKPIFLGRTKDGDLVCSLSSYWQFCGCVGCSTGAMHSHDMYDDSMIIGYCDRESLNHYYLRLDDRVKVVNLLAAAVKNNAPLEEIALRLLDAFSALHVSLVV